MKKIIIGILFLATACTVSQPSETKEDSVATLSEDTLEIATEGYDQIPPVDTVFQIAVIEKKVTTPGLAKNALYVYHKDGLDVTDEGKVVAHADYKARVMKIEMQGELVLVDVDGIMGVVDPEYLLPLPVPEQNNVVGYFTETLMLTKDPVERTNPESLNDSDAMFSFIDYYFEGGFKIMSGSQYESGFTIVNLPGLSMKQAFLFASYFYESFPDSFKEFPTEAREESVIEEKHIRVETNGNRVVNILVSSGEGCYWEDSVSLSENGAVMNSSGGC